MAGVIVCSSGLILQSRLPVGPRGCEHLKVCGLRQGCKTAISAQKKNLFTQRAFGWPCLRTALADLVEDAVWRYAVVCCGKSFGTPLRSIVGVQRAKIRQC